MENVEEGTKEKGGKEGVKGMEKYQKIAYFLHSPHLFILSPISLSNEKRRKRGGMGEKEVLKEKMKKKSSSHKGGGGQKGQRTVHARN